MWSQFHLIGHDSLFPLATHSLRASEQLGIIVILVNTNGCCNNIILVSEKLQDTIRPYLLRRTKAEVALDIPDKSELFVYHPISDLQKKYYKAILTKDAGNLV